MAGFTDLVAQAQPALLGGGVDVAATSGRTWLWKFVDVNDAAGNPINLTGVTGTCQVMKSPGVPVFLTLNFTGGVGEFTVGLPASGTVGLYSTSQSQANAYKWSLKLTSGSESVQVWGPRNSSFLITPEV